MRPGSYSFVRLSPESYPGCSSTPSQSADRRSFALDCTVQPRRSYDIGFNSAKFQNFKAEDGAPATPAVLHFSTR